MEEFLTEVARYVVGVLPWWQAAIFVLALAVIVVLGRRVYRWEAPKPPPDPVEHPPAPPIQVQPDGTIHLDQKPPEEWT